MKKRTFIKLNPNISDDIYKVTAKLDKARGTPKDLYDQASIMLKTAENEIQLMHLVISHLEDALKDIQNSDIGWGDAELYGKIEEVLNKVR